MTPRERLYAAMRGEPVDHVPFCGYPGMVTAGELERKLRNDGFGIYWRVGVVGSESRNVSTTTTNYWEGGRRWVRNTVRTPVGEVWETYRTGGGYGTSLRCEFFIKEPKDYKVVEFMVKDAAYSPNYDGFRQVEQNLGEDGIVIGNLGYTPMQEMIIILMGIERFSIDIVERQDEFLSLYETMCKRHLEQYEIAAQSPAEFVEYGDNVTSDIIGLERFQRYVVPCYNRLGQALHAKGKKVGSHLDGNIKLLKEAVRDSELDFIEAYNPPPDGDLSVREARQCWGKKGIVINFTSSIHLGTPEQIEAHTVELLRDSSPGTGFIISLTENIPEGRWQKSLPIINRVVRERGKLPLRV